MNSYFRNFLSDKGEYIIPYFNDLKLKPNDITTLGLLFNGISLIYLMNNNFGIFITFFFLGYYCDILDGLYARKYNLVTNFGEKYDNIADFLKMYFLYLIFTCKFKKKIKYYHYIFLIIILILCHINFILENLNKNIEHKHKFYIKYINFYKKYNFERFIKYKNITKYFDDTSIIIYLIILMVIIYKS